MAFVTKTAGLKCIHSKQWESYMVYIVSANLYGFIINVGIYIFYMVYIIRNQSYIAYIIRNYSLYVFMNTL